MAKFKFTGIDHYTESLEKLGDRKAGVIKYAVYPGAKIVADAIRAEIESNHMESGDLAASMALSKMQNDNGYIFTRVNFADYDRRGVPNAMKAAALESGTSRGQKATHFISRTVKSVSERAIGEMSKALDEKIGQIMGG